MLATVGRADSTASSSPCPWGKHVFSRGLCKVRQLSFLVTSRDREAMGGVGDQVSHLWIPQPFPEASWDWLLKPRDEHGRRLPGGPGEDMALHACAAMESEHHTLGSPEL